MNKLSRAIRAILPRRRRLWRYVSPHRRVLSLVSLAVLAALAYGYWHLTNDRRIRRQARQYLQALTGGRVEIAAAHFSLLEGIELRDVRLHVPGDPAGEPFFRAKKVVLRHRPWDLLSGGKLQPGELICQAPAVTLEHDVQADRYNFQRLLFTSSHQHAPTQAVATSALPTIRVREGRLRWVDVDQGMKVPFEEMPISLSMVPTPTGQYLITFEEAHQGSQPVISGRLSLDLRTGRATLLSGVAPIPNLDRALPGKYRQWRRLYQVNGEVRISSPAEGAAQGRFMACELVDVSLVLPAEQGGVELGHVSGKVMFDEGGVTLSDVTGQVLHAGGGQFHLSGRYGGYDPSSPYELTIAARSVLLPLQAPPGGQLAEFLDMLDRTCRLSGRCDLSADLRRDGSGHTDLRVLAEPQGMSATCSYVPCRVDDLRGKAEITPGRIELRDLVGSRNGASISIGGTIELSSQGTSVISVSAKDLLLDQELRDALPATVQRGWDVVDPSGRLSASVHVRCVGENVEHVEAVVEMTGTTSARYRYFPYPVDNLIGKAVIRDGDVVLRQVRGSRGLMRCLINGTIQQAQRDDGAVDLAIEARRMPLDGELTAALDQPAQGALASLHAAGYADKVTCRLHRPAGGSLQYQIDAAISGTTFKPEAFPCDITEASGDVKIADGLVSFEGIDGLIGGGTVDISGQADLRGRDLVLDLRARAAGVQFDKALMDAMEASLAETRRQLWLSGRADLDLAISSAPARNTGYRLTIQPRGMEIRHEGFPYTFKGVRGTILASPGLVEIKTLTAADGPAKTEIAGTITSRGGRTVGEMSIHAADLPISEELLAALPSQAGSLGAYFAPAGSCDLDLEHVRWVTVHTPASNPKAASEPSQESGRWELAGSIVLKDAGVKLEGKQTSVSGRLSGLARRDTDGLSLDAQIALDTIDLGQRRMTDVRGRLLKQASSSLVRIEDASANVHKGKAAGMAEIDLSQPPRYGISLSVEDVDLEDLFGSGSHQADQHPGIQVQGLLKGNLRMTSTAGRIETRQASGVLRITKARITRLPVVLGLMNVIYLWLPGKSAFAEGDVTYHLKGEELIFEEIYLRGPAMSVIGSGRVNLSDESLRLVFLTGPPGRMPRMAGIEGLLKGISREIAEIRVAGTLANPVPETVSLPSLDEAIRRLLSPYQQDE